jgi:iron complex outermembrane receptor protein
MYLHAKQRTPRLSARRMRTALLAATIGAGLSVSPAYAQAPEAAADNAAAVPGDIIVTAQFKAERLQNAPLSISGFSGENLSARNLTNVSDLGASVPNTVITPLGAGYGSSLSAFIRGVGLNDNSLSFEPGVPIYIDDVYNGRPQAAILDLLDLETVEVYRGPQGTLFGKNAIGGAVKMVSKKPTGDGHGFLELTTGRFGRIEGRGAFDIAVVPDRLMIRAAFSAKHKQGYGKILDYTCATGETIPGGTGTATQPPIAIPSQTGIHDGRDCVVGHQGGIDDKAARIAVRFVATPDLEFNLVGDYTRQDDQGQVSKYLLLDDTNGLVALWNATVGVPVYGVPLDSRFLTTGKYTNYETFSDGLTGRNYPNDNNVTHWGIANTINWQLGDTANFKSITAYRHFRNTFGRNSDGSPLPFNRTYDDTRHSQFSQEFNLAGTVLDGKIDWATGLYYYEATDSNRGFTVLLPASIPISTDNLDILKTKDYAAFVHGIYHFTDKLSFTAGVRYTKDKKTAQINRTTFEGVTTIPGTEVKLSSERWSPKFELSYQATPDMLAYAQYSTGFRGGGFGPRPSNAFQVSSFQPEDLKSYEGGIKSQLLDRRVTLNLAGFYSTYTNQQAGFNTTDPSGAPWFRTVNTGRSRIYGFEAELQARPVQGLQISGSFGYLNYFRTDPGVSGLCQRLPDGTPCYPSNTPKFNGSFGVQYDIETANIGTFTPRADVRYQSKVFFTNLAEIGQSGYALVSARLSWASPDREWGAALFVTNLTNKYYNYGKLSLESVLGFDQANPAPPREWGLSIRRNF